jgi:hypothetical protein
VKENLMELDTLLHDTGQVPPPTPRALATGRAALDAATATTTHRVTEAGRSRRRRARRLGITTLTAAAASLVFVIGPTLDVGGDQPAARADAAGVLLRAAAAAGEQPGGWRSARYWHSVSSYSQGARGPQRREIWIGHHESGVLKDGGVDEKLLALGPALFPAGARGLTWDQLYALPTDPDALERDLRAGIDGAGPDDDSELFTIVGDLLRESPAPPALRKALWEVAARVPGVRLMGSDTDSIGRTGVAVQRGGQRYLLDPEDGRLLEESQGEPPDGPSTWRGTYLDQGPTQTAPALS